MDCAAEPGTMTIWACCDDWDCLGTGYLTAPAGPPHRFWEEAHNAAFSKHLDFPNMLEFDFEDVGWRRKLYIFLNYLHNN